MHGFKIAIATEDKVPEDLICIGTDLQGVVQDDEDISKEEKVIESVDIFFDTVDNDVREKSSSMLAKIVIKGKISKAAGLTKKLRKISEWAHDCSSETMYRDICIAVKETATSFQVVYVFKKVFVVDYKEIYECDGIGGSNSKAQDGFELRLTQLENNLHKIDVLSDWPAEWEWARKG